MKTNFSLGEIDLDNNGTTGGESELEHLCDEDSQDERYKEQEKEKEKAAAKKIAEESKSAIERQNAVLKAERLAVAMDEVKRKREFAAMATAEGAASAK